MNMVWKWGAALAVVGLTGCSTIYKQPAGAPSARLNLRGALGVKWICVSGQRQDLQPDPTGYADIPAGQRVTIGVMYNNYGGVVHSSCNPRSSFVPVAGQRYYLDFQVEAERCTDFIYKVDPSNRTGLALDSTLGAGTECASQ